MSPKSESVAPINSSNVRALLNTYINFLAVSGKLDSATSMYDPSPDPPSCDMAAIFSSSDPASPLAYTAKETALFLLDFQGFIVEQCGINGMGALSKAKIMRDWAFAQGIMVVHSVVDVSGKPPPTCKSVERITKMLKSVANDRDSAEEPTEIAFGKKDGEYIVLKPPGHVSALKSIGATELMAEHGIKSLILCGLATSGAVLRTAMPATDDGFIVSVIEDACSDPREGLHDTLVKTVLPSRAHVATADEFMKEWQSVAR